MDIDDRMAALKVKIDLLRLKIAEARQARCVTDYGISGRSKKLATDLDNLANLMTSLARTMERLPLA